MWTENACLMDCSAHAFINNDLRHGHGIRDLNGRVRFAILSRTKTNCKSPYVPYSDWKWFSKAPCNGCLKAWKLKRGDTEWGLTRLKSNCKWHINYLLWWEIVFARELCCLFFGFGSLRWIKRDRGFQMGFNWCKMGSNWCKLVRGSNINLCSI